MQKTKDGSFLVEYEGHKWTINSVGTLVRVDYPGGEWVEVQYRDRLWRSVGPGGPELGFEIVPTDDGDRLVRVSDATGGPGSADYEFDDEGRLIRAASSSGDARRYAYHGASERIATIADDNGAVLYAAEYDDIGRIVRLRDTDGLRDGQSEIFEYETLPNGGMRTTVTYPESRVEPGWYPVQVVVHDDQHRMTEERLQPTSTETYVGRFVYDADDNQHAVGALCPVQGATLPADGTLTGPLATPLQVFYVVFARVLIFLGYIIQLGIDQFLPEITI